LKSAKELVEDANLRVDTITVKEALAKLNDAGTVFIDVRDSAEIAAEGKIPGAVHVNRGILELAIDPEIKSMHVPVLLSGKELVFYCVGGMRSALAADTAQDMGLENVCHLHGGFNAWLQASAPVEK